MRTFALNLLFLFVHVNVAVQGVFGNTEIIGNLITGFCDKEELKVFQKSGKFVHK